MVMTINGVFGPWRPDMPDLNNPGVTVARNVTPALGTFNGSVTYFPMKRASLYSATTMGSRPRGSAVGQDRFGNAKVYAGDANKLYKIKPSDRSWQDISRTGGYNTSDTEKWAFTEYGNLIIGNNFSDNPQYIDKNADIKFDDLTTLVKARHSAVVRDFVVVGNTFDALDGEVPYRVRWCAINNPFDWNFSQRTQADFQDVFEGGSVQHIVGGEAGWILLQRSIVKMVYRGAPLVFQFDQIYNKGCSVPESVITIEDKTFFLSDDGFYVLQGDQVTPIGMGKVDNYFLKHADSNQYQYMTVAADPRSKLVYWSYSSVASVTGTPDKMIIYNYQTGEWTEAEATTAFIFNSMSLPWTIEQLDVFGSIEDVPASFDSPIWAGGSAMLWAMDVTGQIFLFAGETARGLIETQEQLLIQQLQQIDPNIEGDRTRVDAIRPFIHGGGSVSVRGAKRSKTTDTLVYTQRSNVHPESGKAYFRDEGRLWRFSFEITGEWTQAMSYQIDANPAGYR